jgi:hypothetical protein
VGTIKQNAFINSWQYDDVGNWRFYNGIQNDVNQLNQYHKFGESPIGYDMNGNLIDDGKNVYQYDAFDRLRNVIRKSDNVVISQYSYAFFNRRVQRIVREVESLDDVVNYIYDGWHEIEERRDYRLDQYVIGTAQDEIVSMTSTSFRNRVSRPSTI